MKKSLVILTGALCAAGTLQAASAAQDPSTNRSEISTAPTQLHEVVNTAAWGFEAPNLFPLDPQQVQSQGAATRPGPRNTLVTPPHGGLVTVLDRSDVPGRE
jgi:hypothetical protein